MLFKSLLSKDNILLTLEIKQIEIHSSHKKYFLIKWSNFENKKRDFRNYILNSMKWFVQN
jgi:hypothetical protein